MGRLPERDTRAGATDSRFGWRPSNTAIALLFVVIFTFGPYLAFTKHVPFTSRGYTLNATFSNAANISTKSPVRIAGVDVGEVISVGQDGNATKVTFTVQGKGRPIHDDAFARIRPRIFLEGNFFIDIDPGSPSAPELDHDATIPVTRTSTSVQLDEVFNALQSPVRADLSRLLEGFGEALSHRPTTAEDRTQTADVKGKTGAEGLNGAFRYGGPAGRYAAQVTNAFLGVESGDLSRMVAGAGRAFGAFARRDEDLKDLIVNFEVFTGALAAQSENLAATFQRFAPALRSAQRSLVSLNRTLPPLRAYAIELEPAVAELPELIAAAKPWTRQARPLFSGRELGGVARLLREATPGLTGAAQAGKASALPQLNRLGLCTTQVLVPTADQTLQSRFSSGGPNYRDFFYFLSNFSGVMQNFDGNGHYLRTQLGGGGTMLRGSNPAGQFSVDKDVWVNSVVPPHGIQPQLGGRPPKRPNVRCHQNPVPALNGPLGQVGPPILTPVSP